MYFELSLPSSDAFETYAIQIACFCWNVSNLSLSPSHDFYARCNHSNTNSIFYFRRVTFSLRRIGTQIKWEQSKRLLPGTLLALSPTRDKFRTKCIVAVVAARPLAGLQQNPPEIDIFFAESGEIEIDPQAEWVMVESRKGFYEGHRHVLKSLQMLANEV